MNLPDFAELATKSLQELTSKLAPGSKHLTTVTCLLKFIKSIQKRDPLVSIAEIENRYFLIQGALLSMKERSLDKTSLSDQTISNAIDYILKFSEYKENQYQSCKNAFQNYRRRNNDTWDRMRLAAEKETKPEAIYNNAMKKFKNALAARNTIPIAESKRLNQNHLISLDDILDQDPYFNVRHAEEIFQAATDILNRRQRNPEAAFHTFATQYKMHHYHKSFSLGMSILIAAIAGMICLLTHVTSLGLVGAIAGTAALAVGNICLFASRDPTGEKLLTDKINPTLLALGH